MIIKNVKEVTWRGKSSLESVYIFYGQKSIEMRSKIKGQWDQQEYCIEYHLKLSTEWETKELFLKCSLFPDSNIFLQNSNGCWYNENDEELRHLRGCCDVDISVTPLTNTLPINRLGKRLKTPRQIEVVFINGLTGKLDRSSQEYHQLKRRLFLYRNLSSGYSSELHFDHEGLITEYPGHFFRV